jgi:hypothetical protein
MDRDCPDDYVETTETSIESTKAFLDHFDHLKLATTPPSSPAQAELPLVQPIITPRFALSCTPELLSSLFTISKSYTPNLPIQTHLSENLAECTRAMELFPDCATYAGVYEKYGLLGEGTILAHCVHLSEEERKVIKRCGAGISHCPGSNLHLNSGAARVREMLDMGIKVSGSFHGLIELDTDAYIRWDLEQTAREDQIHQSCKPYEQLRIHLDSSHSSALRLPHRTDRCRCRNYGTWPLWEEPRYVIWISGSVALKLERNLMR